MLKLGNTFVNKAYLGATEIKKAYLGADVVFDNSAIPFIIEVNATDSTFTIPTTGTYLYDVVTSDGQIISGNTGDLTITFPSAGTYDVEISGVFPRIYFNNGGDKSKLLDIKQWGSIAWGSFERALAGCANLTVVTATDFPNLSGVTTFNNCFNGCGNLTSINVENWDMSNLTTLRSMFYSCRELETADVTNWNISNVISLDQTFRFCDKFDYSLANWDINQVTNFNGLMNGAPGLSTPNYDATLISWAAQNPSLNESPHFGGSKYTLGGAGETARNTLINTYGWTITDGGGV